MGAPYFSRDEEVLARNVWLARQDKFAIPDIQINTEDIESMEFVQSVREKINIWVDRTKVS